MSDPFDVLLDGLRGQRPPTPFAPAAAVRRRGRQRANRQAVSIGVAVLVTTGLGAGGVVTALGDSGEPALPAGTTAAAPPTARPSVPPTGESPTAESPLPGEIPDAWLLTATDLPDAGWEEDTGELLTGAWYWDGAEAWCPEYRTADYSSVAQRVDERTLGWLRSTVQPERVDQLVELFPSEIGAVNVDDVRAFVERCSRRPEQGDPVAPTYLEIQEEGFAGDESLLIMKEQYMFDENDDIVPAGDPQYVVVARVGDAVTTIQFLNLPDDVRTIAQRATARLG
jgi:hypothetical protein